MKWKRTKKGSKDHTRDGKPTATDDDEQKLEIDERDEGEPEDNFNIDVDSPNPDIDEPQIPGLEVKTEKEENNPFHCSKTKTPHLLPHQHFLTNTNFTNFNHCPPFPLTQNTFLRRERENEDNDNHD